MRPLSYTLVSDGSSDRALMYPLTWLLEAGSRRGFEAQWADLSLIGQRAKGLRDRILAALDYFPCDLLFVHRDGEREPRESRLAEIRAAVEGLERCPPVVSVVPVRMMEAWFLLDEDAIRAASGNPRGRVPLELPHPAGIERARDPKADLHEALRRASELRGRRATSFDPHAAVHRVAQLTRDFAPLRALSAFVALERELSQILQQRGW